MFNQKKIKIAFNIMLILIGVFAITQVGLATPFVIGGVILQGILGGFSGKVGPVVGAKWKEIDYMRSYVIPSNPNSAGQQAVRLKFATLVASARGLLSSILQPFWDPFYSNMSGFNKWISTNYALSSSVGLLNASTLMSKGTLETLHSVITTYDQISGVVSAAFSETIFGDGLATDNVALVVFDTLNNDFWIDTTASTRDSSPATIPTIAGMTASNLIVYAFAYRGTGANLVVSDSIGDVAAAA